MPMPPPRLSSSISIPCSSQMRWASETTRAAATWKPDESKICEPMCECRPMKSRLGSFAIRRTASSAAPEDTDSPNFWSSWAVAMNSWVCASTPTVTRTSTGCTIAGAGGSVGDAHHVLERVDDDAPDAGRHGRLDLRHRLVVAVHQEALPRHPGTQRDRELAARRHVDAQALIGDPARDRGREERLGRVVDEPRACIDVGAAVPTGPVAQVGLVEEEQRGSVLADRITDVDSCDLHGTVGVPPAGGGPHRGRQPVHLLRGRRPGCRVVQGEAVGVQWSGGMGAHAERLGHRRAPTSDPVR